MATRRNNSQLPLFKCHREKGVDLFCIPECGVDFMAETQIEKQQFPNHVKLLKPASWSDGCFNGGGFQTKVGQQFH